MRLLGGHSLSHEEAGGQDLEHDGKTQQPDHNIPGRTQHGTGVKLQNPTKISYGTLHSTL